MSGLQNCFTFPTEIKCPFDHPYAYQNGQYCCKTAREKNQASGRVQSCDGGPISLSSTCCMNDQYTSCPYGNSCKNYDGRSTVKCILITKTI